MGKLPSRVASRLLATVRAKPQLLPVASWLLRQVIPFNGPHGFSLLELDRKGCAVRIPFKRRNKNHLGSVHACALVTGGELAAGLYLATIFDPKEFRLLLAELSTSFHRQARESLVARCEAAGQTDLAPPAISDDTPKEIRLTTSIADSQQNPIATIQTLWHLSRWR